MCQKFCDETVHCVGYTFVEVAFRVVVVFGVGDCVLVVILDIMGDDDDSVVVVVVVDVVLLLLLLLSLFLFIPGT